MSFFKQMMAGIGIGASKVDLVLPKSSIRQGERFTGKLIIYSGDVEQQVDEIYLNLVMQTKKEDQHIVRTVDQQRIAGGFVIPAGSPQQELTFEYQIPYDIPISGHKCRYHFQLGLDIKNALDPKDTEYLNIEPSLEMEAVLQGLSNLGFRQQHDSGELEGHFQKFEFVPTGFMRGKLDEVEVIFRRGPQGLTLFMEIDKKSRGLFGALAESMDIDERRVNLTIPYHQLVVNGQPNISEVAQVLSRFIESEYQKIL